MEPPAHPPQSLLSASWGQADSNSLTTRLTTLLLTVVVAILAAAMLASCEAEEESSAPVATASDPIPSPTISVPTDTPIPSVPRTPISLFAPTTPPPLRHLGNELILLVVSDEHDVPEYSRKDWRDWIDEDRDCQNTRHEVLIRQSATPVTFVEEEQCRVASGAWTDPFSEEEFTDPIYLHIDHMVPLANAHKSGGWLWSEDKKRQYLNDLSYDGHLIAVRTTVNSSKGDNGPEKWKPPVEGYRCQYAIDWITVKDKWELFASEAEAAALSEMLETCTPALTLTVLPHEIPQPEATPPPTPTVETTPTQTPTLDATPSTSPITEATPSPNPAVEPAPSPSPTPAESYESCEAAETAGEPRIQGNSGPGKGFPKDKVPGARDGDGDGVVCEK